ncbi:PPOX class F420-dependent oxidoreductase [Knoellia subterranea]|uniref:PPOX class F420-dependent enzyme n=1 Tax=Knoellia subterranea KCTC 19937 TaxID=1385521 RepID=A0A0A0JP47_9MICO|nr:PPOX class F420-dependent oxidoreductase [Knoellia subterranea]KGN37832.1 PPOX class F420-dependent enzyme [Knoellia subterranea KCTC 19937]
MATVPEALAHLLRDPNYGHLATVRRDGSPQVNPMWFLWDEESNTLRFTHTNKRAKFRNLQANPGMALEVIDPDNPFRFIEVRGRLAEVVPDPEGAFYPVLGARYGDPDTPVPPDKADRVILVMSIDKVTQK